MTELILPCPFCGSEATVEEVSSVIGSVSFTVGCDSKDEDSCMGYQSFQTFPLRRDAIEAWNRRISGLGKPMDSAPKDRSLLALIHDGRNPPTLEWEIIIWNSHGAEKGQWMARRGFEFAEDAKAKGWSHPVVWFELPGLEQIIPKPARRATLK